MKKGFLLIEFAIGISIIVMFLFAFMSNNYREHDKHMEEFESLGYNAEEVQIFRKIMNIPCKDFINSTGYQKQYRKFISGIPIDSFLP